MTAGTVSVCPFCDAPSIHHNGTDDEARYRCSECNQVFATPTERAPKGHQNTRQGLAGRLADADPDEVGL